MNTVETGRRLRELRGSRTIRDVAAAVKVSPSSWYLYELGDRIPRDEVKIRIADYFGVKVADIFFP